MKRDLLKRIMVLTLAFLVATVGLPLEAFADNLTHNQTKLNGMLFVQHYDVSDETMYPGPSSLDKTNNGNWMTLNTNGILEDAVYIKTADHGSDNWTQRNDESVFLNRNPSTQKTAFVANGNLHLAQDTYLRAVSDDGVKFSIDGVEASSWALQTNGITTPMFVSKGDYVFEITYFNRGGQGELLFQKLEKKDMKGNDFDINEVLETDWEVVPWNWFYIGLDKDVVEPTLEITDDATFRDSFDVTITPTFENGEAGTVYYTTDGSDPDPNDITGNTKQYEDTFTINEAMADDAVVAIRAIAVDGDNNKSSIVEGLYTVNKTPAETEIQEVTSTGSDAIESATLHIGFNKVDEDKTITLKPSYDYDGEVTDSLWTVPSDLFYKTENSDGTLTLVAKTETDEAYISFSAKVDGKDTSKTITIDVVNHPIPTLSIIKDDESITELTITIGRGHETDLPVELSTLTSPLAVGTVEWTMVPNGKIAVDGSGADATVEGLKDTEDDAPIRLTATITFSDAERSTATATVDVSVIDMPYPLGASVSILNNSDVKEMDGKYYFVGDTDVELIGYNADNIYYSIGTLTSSDTVDSSDAEYLAKYNITETTIVNAVAYNEAGYSVVETKEFIKVNVPVLAITPDHDKTFTSTQEFTLGMDKEGSIYYTTNGTEPSKVNGTLYNGEQTVNNTTTVRAIGYDEYGFESNDVTVVLTKYVAPAVTPTPGPTPGPTPTPTANPDDGYVILEEEENALGLVEFYEPYIFGYPDRSFRPKNSVTRAEVATMFAKILKLNLDYPGSAKYTDVAEGKWYFDYIQALSRTGLFVDDGTGDFRPNDAITRAEMATVFGKFWEFQDVAVNETKVQISDIDETHWSTKYIYQMYNAGIVSGFGDGTYRPNAPTLREQVVIMINTLIARPEYDAIGSKFTDIDKSHWAFGNIEAASQVFVTKQNIPVKE